MKKEPFKYPDTCSTRAKIEYLNRKFYDKKIAIIGVGGTGSYILDLVSKTPVAEIHIFDGDIFEVHTAFRAPGAIAAEKFEQGQLFKVDYYAEIYSRMHNGIVPHKEYITQDNISGLSGFDFVFISIDKNEARSMITKALLSINVPFVDSGLGIDKVGDELMGSLRVTTGTHSKNDHLPDRIGEMELGENEYSTNIQIADLNCLCACLAVGRWKKFIGFYQDLKQEHNSLYFINTGKLINDDLKP